MLKHFSIFLISCIVLASFSACSSDNSSDPTLGSTFQPDSYDYTITGKSYYVNNDLGSDSNSGDMDNPFASVSHALTKVSGGDAIYVDEGNYGDLTFGADYETHSAQGYAQPIEEVFDEWVTILPVEGAHPEFDKVVLGTWTDKDGIAIPFSQEGNSDLRLRIDGHTINDEIKIYGSRYVDVRNCYITQQGYNGEMTDDEKAEFMSGKGVAVVNGKNIIIYNNEIAEVGLGAWLMTTNLAFKDNHIHNAMHDGLWVLGGKNILIEGNRIHDLDDGAADDEGKSYNMHVDGMHIYIVSGADKWAHDFINFTFRNNLIYHTEAMGIMLNANIYEGGIYSNFLWENNIFAPSNGTLVHMGAEIEDGFIFRNNTVVYTPHDQWISDQGRTMGKILKTSTAVIIS